MAQLNLPCHPLSMSMNFLRCPITPCSMSSSQLLKWPSNPAAAKLPGLSVSEPQLLDELTSTQIKRTLIHSPFLHARLPLFLPRLQLARQSKPFSSETVRVKKSSAPYSISGKMPRQLKTRYSLSVILRRSTRSRLPAAPRSAPFIPLTKNCGTLITDSIPRGIPYSLHPQTNLFSYGGSMLQIGRAHV